MANYNTLVKVFRNTTSATADANLQSYLNSVDSSKTIRGLSTTHTHADNLVIVLVIDA